MVLKTNAYRVLVGSQEESDHKENPDVGWGNSISMDLREMGYDVMDWINLPEDRGL
jgi:hypothetical protein